MADTEESGSLEKFAEAAALEPGTGGDLPHTGTLLSRSGLQADGAVHGQLPGDHAGSLCHLRYTTTNDDTTTTHRKTAVVMRVPESIGYAPFLQIGSGFGVTQVGGGYRLSNPAPGVRLIADGGIDEGWLMELFSPALGEWLGRSPKDFGAELADGVLVVLRETHLTDERELTNLCIDAARIAGALRDESIEESESGGGTVATAGKVKREEVLARNLTPELMVVKPPVHIASELGQAQRLAVRSPMVWAATLRSTLLWMLVTNVVGGGIYGLLLNLPNPLMAVLVYQVILLVIIGNIIFRKKTSAVAALSSEQAFWESYAKSRDLKLLEPLRFAAENAEANLPGRPVRVYEGLFGGTAGALMMTGDGRERGHQIALVRGPHGPTAVSDLNVSAPGISAAALDEYVATLLMDLDTQPALPAQQ